MRIILLLEVTDMRKFRIKTISIIVVAVMLIVSAFAFSGCGCVEKKGETATDASGNPITSSQTAVQQTVKKTDKNGKVIKDDKKAKATDKAKEQKNKKLKKKGKLKSFSEGDGDDISDLTGDSGKKSKKNSSKKSSSKKSSKKSSGKKGKKGNLEVGENTEEGWGPLEDGK